MIEAISAANARFTSESRDVIILDVQFSHLEDVVEFAASVHDIEPHGREIHARALAGEFGPVAEYVPPTHADIAARDNPSLRRQQMKQATEQTTHWNMMGDPEQAAAWRSYYREIYALEQAPEWPLVEQWPISPVCAR